MRPAWRLIEDAGGEAARNMALDEAIATHVRSGGSPPTLRLYGWDRPSVTLGAFQRAAEVDATLCADADIPLVRRPTGGRAILHGNELTYSFSAPTCPTLECGAFSHGLFSSYKALSRAFEHAFAALGLPTSTERSRRAAPGHTPLCFESASFGEMTAGRRKIIGSAQRRWPGGLLQQGSIPLTLDYTAMERVFGPRASGARDLMAGLSEFLPSVSIGDLRQAIVEAFADAFGIGFVAERPTREEEDLATDFMERKYRLPDWTFRR
jgi:lipoate-protein ligase A